MFRFSRMQLIGCFVLLALVVLILVLRAWRLVWWSG